MRLVIALLLAASFLWHPGLPESAAESVTMSIRPGLDGLVRLGTWLPVELEVSNRGADVSGSLELQVEGTNDRGSFNSPAVSHSTPAVLPRYSHKRFLLEVYVPTAASRVTARFAANGNVLVQQDVPLETVPSGELLCGVLSRNATVLDFLPTIALSARQRGVRLAHLELSDVPTRPQVLSSLDCLILSNLSTGTLSDEQAGALQSWVSAGGLLVVAGGQNWQKTMANLPPALSPVKISGTVPVPSLNSLVEFAQQKIGDPGPWLASQATVTDGTTIVAEGNLPILVAARRGAGAVFYLALDPASEPLRSWAGSEQLWRYVLSSIPAAAASPSVAARQYSGWGRMPRQALIDISDAKPPAGGTLGVIILAYVFLLVPISYLGLRRLRRLELSAVVAGLVIVGAAAIGFTVANANRNADVVVNKITIVRAWDDVAPAYAHTYVSLFTPQASRLEFGAPRDALMQSIYYPLPKDKVERQEPWMLKVVEGELPTVRGYDLPANGLGTLAVDSQFRGIPVTGDILVKDGHLTGSVTNRSDKALADAAVVVGNQAALVGTLAAGQSRAIAFDLKQAPQLAYLDASDVIRQLYPVSESATSGDEGTRRDIVDAALNANYSYYSRVDLSAVSFVAWLPENPLRLDVPGRKTMDLHRTLLVSTLPVRFAPGRYARIPSELIERRPMSVSVGTKLQRSGFALSVGESASTEYTLPVQHDQFDVDHLALDIAGTINDGSDAVAPAALGSAYVFDWQKADWTEVNLTFGENVLPDPQRFVSPLGIVRVRYTFRPSGDASLNRFHVSRFDILIGGHAR